MLPLLSGPASRDLQRVPAAKVCTDSARLTSLGKSPSSWLARRVAPSDSRPAPAPNQLRELAIQITYTHINCYCFEALANDGPGMGEWVNEPMNAGVSEWRVACQSYSLSGPHPPNSICILTACRLPVISARVSHRGKVCCSSLIGQIKWI